MDSPNPYQSPVHTESARVPNAEAVSDTLRGAVLQGIRLGWKWITIIIGPIAVLMLLASIVITVFVEGSAVFTDPALRRESLTRLSAPFGLYLGSCVWGVIGGLLVCVPLHLVRRITRKRTIEPGASNDPCKPSC